ncbi:unnamed protein product [Acanthoscelides obtectus]|uniref:Uncharacterized protein n=1 Tax=Acanthoscelides obtectus TaxID=200917 RepID=A0A9P0KNP9_ACAOB|nr:unnamed protein product [Acanthoscelides obtectus]CAK1641671.1 hypothetical protein AOBTE_LOCUS12549 [Acanthoscelides obtectus]
MSIKDRNMRHLKIEIIVTRYHNEEVICHKSSVIKLLLKAFNIMIIDHSNLVSSVPNNLAHYGYTTALEPLSPVTHTPSPATTNASNESELELFCE